MVCEKTAMAPAASNGAPTIADHGGPTARRLPCHCDLAVPTATAIPAVAITTIAMPTCATTRLAPVDDVSAVRIVGTSRETSTASNAHNARSIAGAHE